MTFYQVFDSGRFCVLNSEGKELQRKREEAIVDLYTMMLATVRNVRCFAAVTIFARGCYRYTTFQSIVSQLHGLPGADPHITTEWPLLPLCFFSSSEMQVILYTGDIASPVTEITSLQDYNTIIRNVLKTIQLAILLKSLIFFMIIFQKELESKMLSSHYICEQRMSEVGSLPLRGIIKQ